MFIFFFQAEDGIRYRTVTGVRTCALPISRFEEMAKTVDGYGERVESPGELPAALKRGLAAVREGRPAILNVLCRSEERRVGKEGRTQNTIIHKNNNFIKKNLII